MKMSPLFLSLFLESRSNKRALKQRHRSNGLTLSVMLLNEHAKAYARGAVCEDPITWLVTLKTGHDIFDRIRSRYWEDCRNAIFQCIRACEGRVSTT